jgi:two-component system chemotaxis response regulator CheY
MSTVLVIDDSASIVQHFSLILQGGGYEVATAGNGKEGIDQIDAGLKPSIILTDLNMPDMDGVAFIKAARRTAATRFTPIIVLSSDTDGRRRDAARAAGASGWLTKPPQPSQLLAVVKQLAPLK